MDKLRVGIVFGGRSVEHEVSIASATSILAGARPVPLRGVADRDRHRTAAGSSARPACCPPHAVTRRGGDAARRARRRARWCRSRAAQPAVAQLDVILPIVHGSGGEDGSLQGFLELAGVPYVGAGVLGSAIQMDKEVAKRLLARGGHPGRAVGRRCAPHELAASAEGRRRAQRSRELGLPCFVKPANSARRSASTRRRRAQRAARGPARRRSATTTKLLVEQRRERARDRGRRCSATTRPRRRSPARSCRSASGTTTRRSTSTSDTELLVPAPLDEEQVAERAAARDPGLPRARGRRPRARRLLPRPRHAARFYLNELNSLPGFTEVSMYPRLWQATGLSYPALLDRLIELALERDRVRGGLERTYRRG